MAQFFGRSIFVLFIASVMIFSNLCSEEKSLHESRIISMESVDLKETEEFYDRQRLGHHLVIDLFGCNPEKIKQVDVVEEIMVKAALAAGATIVAKKFHQFNPFGVSGAVIVSESHLAIHTWPEVQGYCAIDIFTCGKTDNFAALEVMKEGFEAKGFVVVEIERGKQRKYFGNSHDGEIVFRESLDPLGGFKTTIATTACLEDVQSPLQNIKVYDTHALGKILVVDGVVHLTEYDNAAYHEMEVHVPMQVHPSAKKVLICNGEDGGVLSELVKYKSLEEIVVCNVDQKLTDISGKHFPAFAAAYQDPRVRIVYQESIEFVKKFENYFDVIFIDATDLYGAVQGVTTDNFYSDVHQALSSDGVMVSQAESLYYDSTFIASIFKKAQEFFPIVKYYHTLVPSYPSGTIGFLFASKKYMPTENLGKNLQCLGNLQYYNQGMHRASFELPQFLHALLSSDSF